MGGVCVCMYVKWVLREWVGCQKRSVSTGIWAGNPTLHFRSTSSNYVRHLEWPEKLSIIYAFTSLESRAAIFFFSSQLLTLQLTVLVPEDFEWKISTEVAFLCVVCWHFSFLYHYDSVLMPFILFTHMKYIFFLRWLFFFLTTAWSLHSFMQSYVLKLYLSLCNIFTLCLHSWKKHPLNTSI